MGINIDKELEWDPFVKELMKKLKDLEDKIDLVKSDTAFTIKQTDKILKKVK